ncbi:hypothetical protein GDO81_009288 [Engystomops pustulosus]|uniref:Uncharacterized protein n=1 Tax=Engystomops pustulosus TaxID=76066 RepID=A0AAV7BPT0_ENGPU|nr:hypothetical protein GDO81_009288 [Engystomops pustulosus]
MVRIGELLHNYLRPYSIHNKLGAYIWKEAQCNDKEGVKIHDKLRCTIKKQCKIGVIMQQKGAKTPTEEKDK